VGLDTTFPPLDGSEWVVGSPERLIRIIIHGVTGEIEVQGEFFRGLMPPWGPTLKDFDVAAVATHVRGSWGNKATAISESTVARIRKSTAWRTTPWTQAELRRFPP
jgi:mono/diheme cytochrome c family protein